MEDDIKLVGDMLRIVSIFLEQVVDIKDLDPDWPDHAMAMSLSICGRTRGWDYDYACKVGDAYIDMIKEGTVG